MVTTHERIDGALFSQDLFAAEKMLKESRENHGSNESRILCIVTWGPLVQEHIKLIRKNLPKAEIIFYAQSFGWGIKVPAGIPIICVSRFVMSQWALYSKGNFVGYVPPSVDDVFIDADRSPGNNEKRDIDVLVHLRKQNHYCIKKLIPALKKAGIKVEIIENWIDQPEFAKLLQRSKVFLYCTELHKAGFFRRLPGEGFGLPPLEALVSGCKVASNLLGGVTDFLTPGVNCIKVETDSVKKDVAAIEKAMKNFEPTYDAKLVDEYSEKNVTKMWKCLLNHLYESPQP